MTRSWLALVLLGAVRDHLSEVVDRVEHQHERVTMTWNGREVAVLGDPEALADIREAEAAYARGDVLRGVDAVRRLGR